VLSVLLRFTDSDYPFGTFKLFLYSVLSNKLHISQYVLSISYVFLFFLLIVNLLFKYNNVLFQITRMISHFFSSFIFGKGRGKQNYGFILFRGGGKN
jgi:hypothetical protein